jgi:hypothetical protein
MPDVIVAPVVQCTIQQQCRTDARGIRRKAERIVRIGHDTETIRHFKQLNRTRNRAVRPSFLPPVPGSREKQYQK